MNTARHKTQNIHSSYAGHKDGNDRRRVQQSGGTAALADVQEPLRITAASGMTASTAMVVPGKENVS
jgi:hypothetical protein